jgi:hypothetical protein
VIGSRIATRVIEEFRWTLLAQAGLVAVPCIALAVLLQENVLLRVGLLAIVLLIPSARLQLHAIAILCVFGFVLMGIALIFAIFPNPTMFVLVSAVLGGSMMLCTYYGADLRSLGVYCFIPALYLGCELRQEHAEVADILRLGAWVGLAPVLVIVARLIFQRDEQWQGRQAKGYQATSRFRWLSDKITNYGTPNARWSGDALTMACAVATSATIMRWGAFLHPEWGIWSAASVVTSEAAATYAKLRSRGAGALAGVTLGVIAAPWTPRGDAVALLATIGIMVSLVGMKTYTVSFGARCFLITVGAAATGAAYRTGISRVENVLIGAAIGAVAVSISYWIRSAAGESTVAIR